MSTVQQEQRMDAITRHEKLLGMNRKLYYTLTERVDHKYPIGSRQNLERKQAYVDLVFSIIGELYGRRYFQDHESESISAH